MRPSSDFTSGSDALDRLIDGVRVGDNLVVVGAGGARVDWVMPSFLAAADPERLVVVDAHGRHTGAAGRVLDWSRPEIASPAGVAAARAELADADQAVGRDALFAFDDLSALSAAWGEEPALDLFLWACPRLYHRSSIALWLLERERHDEEFLRRLTEITQVVVVVEPLDEEDVLLLRVEKADGRLRALQGRRIEALHSDGKLVELRSGGAERQRLGESLRAMRVRRGIGQSELARRVGISPSALSQAERGVRGVSAETLTRIWEVLGVPFGPDDPLNRGYRVSRRGAQIVAELASGASARQLSDDPEVVWLIDLDPRAAGRQPLFDVKGAETIVVLRGVLRLEVGAHSETLQAGDALVADRAAIAGWANPADTPAQVLWIIS